MAGFPLLQKDMELNSVGTMLMLQIQPEIGPELALTKLQLESAAYSRACYSGPYCPLHAFCRSC